MAGFSFSDTHDPIRRCHRNQNNYFEWALNAPKEMKSCRDDHCLSIISLKKHLVCSELKFKVIEATAYVGADVKHIWSYGCRMKDANGLEDDWEGGGTYFYEVWADTLSNMDRIDTWVGKRDLPKKVRVMSLDQYTNTFIDVDDDEYYRDV